MGSRYTPLDRRAFIRTASAAGAGLWITGRAPNERVRVAVMGVNSRGDVLAQTFAGTPNAEVAWVVDVDERAMTKTAAEVGKRQSRAPRTGADFRRALDDKDVDALYIAAPDHWHAPATLLALKAGKHVYVEKPCGHNPREGELLVEAQRRYPALKVTLGTQQRSGPATIELVQAIAEGALGRAYMARTWYANTRGSIGQGKAAPVPAWLDYELWQGPAPRLAFRDNVVHYNWHWFWRWGTGEIANNGTHELDVARWALGVDFPTRVSSSGGRYHFKDDWEFPDTQDATFEFEGGRIITWHGRSCNGIGMEGKPRGTLIYGTQGSAFVDRDGYVLYDLKGKKLKENISRESASAIDVRGGDNLTDYHVRNFVDAIRTGAKVNAPIEEGHKSVLLPHLGNIAHKLRRDLQIDPRTGRIVGDAAAMKMWSREYAKGWEPTV